MNLYPCATKLRQKLDLKLFPLLCILLAQVTSAANLSREQRISEGLERMVSDGNPVWLEAESVRFLGIHRQTSAAKRLGGAILLHDGSTHADWHEVINPLRRDLTERGWDTLSIQTPISDDLSDPVAVRDLLASSLPRIQAAADFLTDRQVDALALIGHGIGAKMAMNFISQPGNMIRAAVVIGVPMSTDDDQDPVFLAIKDGNIPILDLYGSRDHAAVVDSAPFRRAIAVRNGRNRYRLEEVAGGNHFFSGLQEELSHRVAAWLRQALGQ
jgi:pimeloyl-ACP methyl ester carboxylesterase